MTAQRLGACSTSPDPIARRIATCVGGSGTKSVRASRARIPAEVDQYLIIPAVGRRPTINLLVDIAS